jgi:hypothetical protein
MSAVAHGCPNVMIISIHMCELITDIAIKNLARLCHNIYVLDVGGCKMITDASIVDFANSGLETLWVDKCPHITNASISLVGPSLKVLHADKRQPESMFSN